MRRVLLGLDVLVVVLILVQAVLAGQSLFEGSSISVHGYVGNGTFAVAVIAAFVALAARVPVWVLSTNALLALLLFFQTGLGYVGRDSALAASWHIPLGVSAFGLAAAALVGGALVVSSSGAAPGGAVAQSSAGLTERTPSTRND
ncbi:MAG: hypothetical protein FJW94_07430 [Actinobacteria bacterium]|nr:hypothetical protein [Actinomycetota bacterium]